MNYQTALPALVKNGYIPLPIKQKDKRPAIKNWTAPDYSPPTGFPGCGVGILCGRGPAPISGIDCDIMDAAIAGKVGEYILSTCGETPYRIGKAPKTMYVYRATTAGIRKISSKHYDIGHVEMWGFGQQFVCFGIHPDTKGPYTWPGPLGDILSVPAEVLQVITEEKLRNVITYFERLAEASGYKPLTREKAKVATSDDFDPLDPLDVTPPIGLSLEKCAEMLQDLDPDCSRDEWRNLGMALHHEFGGADEARDLWDTWSAKGEKYTGDTVVQWESFGKYSGRPLTAAYLLKQAKEEAKPEEVPGEDDFFRKMNWSTSRFVDDPPGIPMVVNGFLPKGIVSLFYSAGGAGKSTIVLGLALRIAIAGEFDVDFFGHVLQGGRAVVVTAEDPELILNRRFMGLVDALAEDLGVPRESIRETVDQNLSIVSTFGHQVQLFRLKPSGLLTTTTYYTSLVTALKSIGDLQFVVIDTKTRYSPGEGLGNVTATQEITFYESMAKETGASVMLLHHSNKTSRDGSQTGAQAYRDATALFDSVRAAWYLRGLTAAEVAAQDIKDDGPGRYLLLENSKNNYIPLCAPLVVRRDGYRYSGAPIKQKMSSSDRKEVKLEQAYSLVIEMLQITRGQWHSQAEVIRLCKEQGLGRRYVVEALGEGLEDGLIDRKQEGVAYRYSLTEQGKLYNVTIGDDLV